MQQLSTDFNATASQAAGLLGFFGVKTATPATPAASDRGSGGNRSQRLLAAAGGSGGNRSKLAIAAAAAAASRSKALVARPGGSGGELLQTFLHQPNMWVHIHTAQALEWPTGFPVTFVLSIPSKSQCTVQLLFFEYVVYRGIPVLARQAGGLFHDLGERKPKSWVGDMWKMCNHNHHGHRPFPDCCYAGYPGKFFA